MAVVINEFEVVDSAPPLAHGAGDTTRSLSTPPLPDPEDLRRLLAVGAELQLRRYAH
jgi:hypothetical protein